jgi:adenylosuccinate lyase
MRRYGLENPYEQLKELTRGRAIDGQSLREFVQNLEIPAAAKERLQRLTPGTYTGMAAELARRI